MVMGKASCSGLVGGCEEQLLSWHLIFSKQFLRAIKQRTVARALENCHWVSDIKVHSSVPVLSTSCYGIWLITCCCKRRLNISTDESSPGLVFILANQPIMLSLLALFVFAPWKRIWKSWAPQHCKFFIWLAINNRCWTGDRLAKRGLPHPAACPESPSSMC